MDTHASCNLNFLRLPYLDKDEVAVLQLENSFSRYSYLNFNSVNCLVEFIAASIVNLTNCYLNCLNNTGISYTSSSGSSAINIRMCNGDLGTTGIALYASSGSGTMYLSYSSFKNSGASTTANTCSAGNVNSDWTDINNPITYSSAAGGTWIYCGIFNSSTNTISVTTSGTAIASILYCRVTSGSASCITVGAGSSVSCLLSEITSSNTNAITGAGTIILNYLAFTSSSSKINTTTQTPQTIVFGSYQVVNPAGDYTVLNSDYFVGATTSAARAITLPATPVIGETHVIKDITGTGNANNITVSGNGHNIDGAATYVMATNYGSTTFTYNGTNWFVT